MAGHGSLILLISVYEISGKVSPMTFNLIAAIKLIGAVLVIFGGICLLMWVASLLHKLGSKYLGRQYGGDGLVAIYCLLLAGIVAGFIIP